MMIFSLSLLVVTLLLLSTLSITTTTLAAAAAASQWHRPTFSSSSLLLSSATTTTTTTTTTMSSRRSLQGGTTAATTAADADCGRLVMRFLEMEIGCSTDEDCSRRYYLYIPCITDSSPDEIILPVLFVVHCFGCSFDTMKHWKVEAERYGFVLVIPQGLGQPLSFNAKVCCGYSLHNNIDDKAFFQQIQNQLQTQYGPNRISTIAQYAAGWSNGGYMVTYSAELFRAVAPISGFQYDDIDQLSPNHPVGLFLHHAADDGNVQVTGCCTDNSMPRCCCGISEASPDTCLSAQGFVEQFAQIINIPKNCDADDDSSSGSSSSNIEWKELVIEGITCYTGVVVSTTTTTTTSSSSCQLLRNTTYCIHPTGQHFNAPTHEKAFTMRNAIMDFFARDICSISDSTATWDSENLQCSSCANNANDASRTRYCLSNNNNNNPIAAGDDIDDGKAAAATAATTTSSSSSARPPPNEWNAVIIPFLLMVLLSGIGFFGFQKYRTNRDKYAGFQVVATTTPTVEMVQGERKEESSKLVSNAMLLHHRRAAQQQQQQQQHQ